jgi:acyl transferase domain-containing protein/phosphopantetheinyl transferase/acyl carrier protein
MHAQNGKYASHANGVTHAGTISAAPDVAGAAIVGMSCIFPGAPDPKTYWRNIVGKVDSVSEASDDWGADVFYDPESTDNDRIYCKRGGFLHDLATFDPLEYGVMPSSIDGGEPDHFLALRVAHEALADAGYRGDGKGSVRGDRVEVIIGRGAYINRGFTNLVQHGMIVDQTLRLLSQLHPEHTGDELARIRCELKASLPPFNPEMAPGLVPNILSGRIANRLDLMGPNFTVDAACASSLIAVERAIQDLQAGRCDMALTGGIQCTSPPPIFMVFCQLNALSRRGRIQPFSDEADGTLLGEGLGLIVLKRVADAVRDGDRIYAVIRSVGSASDGRALGLLAPRVEGEELAMRRAYEASGISPASVGLLEAHGTGTPVGDQTEAQALARVFGSRGDRPPSCALGSVKSMISHLIPAAGIAGIIKTALALHYKVLPPTLHCERLNPRLGLEQTPLYVNTETRPWIHGLATPRRAGVNAFGFGGINAHAILEEFIPTGPLEELDGGPPWDNEVVILRAKNRATLLQNCKRIEYVLVHVVPQQFELCDLAYSVNCDDEATSGRGVCLAIVASSIDDLKRKLAHSVARLEDKNRREVRDAGGIYFFEHMLAREGKLAFLFPGEGAQYLNMFADLCLRLPLVRQKFDLIDRAFRDHARGWLPSQVIFPPPLPDDSETRAAQERRLGGMDFAAEAVFAASQGMFTLLTELGIACDMTAGHSGGETSALLAAGVIRVASDTELVRHITDINQLYLRLSADGMVPDGCAFAVSGADREAVIQTVRDSGRHLDIGMDNCPHQVVLCGRESLADALVARLSRIGALCTPLPFQRPYHTQAFEPYCNQLAPFFDRLQIGTARIPAYSAATATPFPDDPEAIRRLASRQTALPVRFRETLEAMHNDGARIFVEVGPKGSLTSFVTDTLRARRHAVIASDLPGVPGTLQLNRMLGFLAAHGVDMRLNRLYERRGARRIDLNGSSASGSVTAAKKGVRLATGLTNMRLDDVSCVRQTPVPVPGTPARAVVSAVPVSGTAVTGACAPAMQAYLDSMDQFLAVQKDVMEAYFNRSGSAGAVADQPVAAPEPPANAEVKPEPTAVAKNGVQPDGTANVLTTLLSIISDRTGYPADMLDTALNLEADLGIDSIKRIEILGALNRQTGLVGPDRMEHVSSLKTIGQILECLEEVSNKTRRALPLAGKVEFEDIGKIIAVREFDTARDLFLNDHALGGRVSALDPSLTGLPLIPLTMTVELMAVAAAPLWPGKTLIGMRNIAGRQWLALDHAKLVLRTVAKRVSDGAASEAEVQVCVDGDDTPVAEGIAVFAEGYPDPPPPQPLTLQSVRPSKWTQERLYRDHMFHGPGFRGIESIEQWGENGLSATLVSLPASGLFQGVEKPELLTDPVLVDAAGQMIGYWAAEHLSAGFNVFPYRIASLRFYGPRLPEQRRAKCHAHIRSLEQASIRADLEIIDDAGRLLLSVGGWEDVRVDLPDSFYRLCISPHKVFLSAAGKINPHATLCSIDIKALPSLSAHGAIWLRTLVHALLNRRERKAWQVLTGPERRRIEWLLGRCCAKDAVRLLAEQEGQPELLPADVEITPDENGRPAAASGTVRPAVSISHADGVAVAAATLEPGMAIGVDVQRLDATRDGFEDAAFTEGELAFLTDPDPQVRRERALRFWCAKEAAAKALGYGMLGGPGSMIVRSYNASDGSVSLEAAGELAKLFAKTEYLAVDTSRHDDLIVATCLRKDSGGERS